MILRRGPKQQSSAAGFSLMELLIVVAIISALSVAAAPNFRQVVEETRVQRASSELRSLWISQRLHYLHTGRFARSIDELLKADLLPTGARGATAGFEFKIKRSSRGVVSLQAIRDGGSGWGGKIQLDQKGNLTGELKNRAGDEVKP